jgi:homoserine dehydrogenase
MKQGINIITPNKKLGSGPLARYQAVKKLGRESYIHFFYEVREGAVAPMPCVHREQAYAAGALPMHQLMYRLPRCEN